jgi:di/tricarboxylate transporter
MSDATIVFLILGAVVALFVSDKLRMDVVALMAVLALMLTGQLSAAEALAGFGDPVVILIAALFVVGEGLSRTGVAQATGAAIARAAGGAEIRLLALMMGAVAMLSAVMSSTGAVAVFIPIVLGLAAQAGVAPGRLMMPLAFAALIGGMLTLIGTPPNLIVNAELRRAGLEPFGFFDFTPIGLCVLVVGVALMALLGPRLLPSGGPATGLRRRPTTMELIEGYGLSSAIRRIGVGAESALAGRALDESRVRSRFGVTILGVERARGAPVVTARAATRIDAGDVVLAMGEPGPLDALAREPGLEPLPPAPSIGAGLSQEFGVVEAVVGPDAAVIGKRLDEAALPAAIGLTVLARSPRLRDPAIAQAEDVLRFGDVLLLGGEWERIRALAAGPGDLVVLRLPSEFETVAPRRERAGHAIAVTLGMMALFTLQIVPSVATALIAALAMVLTRCVSMPEAYRAINWQSVVLIGGMLPMASALDRSGGFTLIVDGLLAAIGGLGPLWVMAALMGLTSLLSQVISNTATTVLVAPIAVAAAAALGAAPQPMLMGVAIAASTAFATPVASPVNTLVLGPGGYRFGDFLRMGAPLQIAALAVALGLIPLLFPF